MMKKNVVKILAILLVAFMIVGISSAVMASGYLETDKYQGKESAGGDKAQDIANIVIGFVQVIGIAAAVIMLIVLAIKYVSAAPGEKADIKKSAVIYVVGAVLLFAATGVLELVKGLATTINGEGNASIVVEKGKLA